MAREPEVSYEGFAFKVKRFDRGGVVVSTSVTPSWHDRQSDQWNDLPTLDCDVNLPNNNKRMNGTVDEIERLLASGESVTVFVSGSLTEREGKKGGMFKQVYARRLYVVGHRPKQNGGQSSGFAAQPTPAPAPAPAPAQPAAADPWDSGSQAADPWSQPSADDETEF